MGPLAPGGVAPPRQFRPEELLNIRDAMSAFLGKGYWSSVNENAHSLYSHLAGIMGPALATKMYVQMAQHNQRPDMLALGPEERIQRFYDMGSKDPAIADLIMRTGQLGQGPIPGYRESPNNLASEMLNKQWYKDGAVAAPGALSTIRKAAAAIQ